MLRFPLTPSEWLRSRKQQRWGMDGMREGRENKRWDVKHLMKKKKENPGSLVVWRGEHLPAVGGI